MALPATGVGNTAPYIIDPNTGLPYGGSGRLSGVTNNQHYNYTYSQNAISPDAYYRRNPALMRESGDIGRTPGQVGTYNNGQRVAYNPNVPITQTHRVDPVGDAQADAEDSARGFGTIALGAVGAAGAASGAFGEGAYTPGPEDGYMGGGGTTTGAATGTSSGGGGMFDDFTGGFMDGGGDAGGYVPGPEDGYVPTDPGTEYTPGPEDGPGNPSGLPNTTGNGLPSAPPGTSSVIGRLFGGGGRPAAPGTRPGSNGGNNGAANGVIASGVGALVGNNLVGGGGFANRNDAAAGGFDNEASLANQLWQMYQQNYGGPGGITTQAIQDARNIDSPENQARVMGAAHADSSQATDAASRAAIERLRQYGVNPSSDRLASLNAQIQASGAAADAGAQTQARQHVVDTGVAARQTMAQMGNSLPGAAMTGMYSSGVGNAGLGRSTFDQANTVGTGIGSMIQPAVGGIGDWLQNNGGVSGAVRGIGDWLSGSGGNGSPAPQTNNGATSDGDNVVSGVSEQPARGEDRASFNPNPNTAAYGKNTPVSGWGGSTGGQDDSHRYRAMSSSSGYSRGGLIHGPGTGTSDSVPAVGSNREPIRVSNGEYIIPADVVRHKGVEFFDRIVGKHHAPVATGVRRA